MPDQLPRILIISSPDPTTSLGTYALPFYSALKKHGYEVDFLTKHRVKGHPEFDYLLDLTRWPNYIRYKLDKRRYRKSIQKTLAIAQTGGHVFDYGREDDPPIPPKQILKKIKKKYDIVFIVFWYQMISYQTIEAIYNKLHCQIHLSCVDNQAVAGGCHFIGGIAVYFIGVKRPVLDVFVQAGIDMIGHAEHIYAVHHALIYAGGGPDGSI